MLKFDLLNKTLIFTYTRPKRTSVKLCWNLQKKKIKSYDLHLDLKRKRDQHVFIVFKQILKDSRPPVQTDCISLSGHSSPFCRHRLQFFFAQTFEQLTGRHSLNTAVSHAAFKWHGSSFLDQFVKAKPSINFLPSKLKCCLLPRLEGSLKSAILSLLNRSETWHFIKLLHIKLRLFLIRRWGIWSGTSHFNNSAIMYVEKSLVLRKNTEKLLWWAHELIKSEGWCLDICMRG